MHPRNRHQARYDFESLIRSSPELAAFVRANPYGDDSIDFAEPAAVTALNRALLQHFYGITHWQIPSGYLCPPIPGRADYLHHVADLLAQSHGGSIPRGTSCAILDIGVGANCIYPIIGVKEYGWRFVGSDIDSVALASARTIVAANPSLADHVECRLQKSADAIFQAVVRPDEVFDVSICNPPFHASAQEAAAGTRRKVRNLAGHRDPAPSLNFGGRSHELWCRGGEAVFVRHMIAESAQRPDLCRWFSTLVSKSENLPRIRQALQAAGAVEVRTIEMAQGQKKSRMVAWTFLGPAQRGRHRSNRGTGP